MPNILRRVKLTRIDLVDSPANPGARVLLVKRDAEVDKRIIHRNGKWEVTTEDGSKILGTHTSREDAVRQLAAVEANKSAPTLSSVHVNRPGPYTRRKKMAKKTPSLLKRFMTLLKEAEGSHSFVPPAGEEPTGPEGTEDTDDQMGEHLSGLTKMHEEMGKALKDLPADHPMHAMHKALGEHISAMQKAHEEQEPNPSEPTEPGEDHQPEVKKYIREAIAKRTTVLEKALAEAKAQATEAIDLAKAERSTRELGEVTTDLRKFAHSSIDAVKDAPLYKKLKDADPELYKSVLEKLAAADAIAKQTKDLETALGSSSTGSAAGTAWAEICAEADKIVAKDASMTKEKARNMIMETRLDLTKRYYAEQSKTEPTITQ